MWTTRLLQIGEFRLDAGCMFGIIPRVVWTRWFPASGSGAIDDKNRMPLQQNSLLLENNGKLVIVEVGIGDKLPAKERDLYAQTDHGIHHALHQIDCRPEDISAVIVTHLHFDHAAGLTRLGPGGDPVLTFPNAEIICQRQEWKDAVENKSTMHKTYLRDHLTPEVAARMRLVDGDTQVLPGIHVVRMPGHTWGQQGVLINSAPPDSRLPTPDSRPICFVPDVLPTALHFRPTTNMAYDVEPYVSTQERRKLLERAHRENWTLVLDHEPGHPVFTAVPDPKTGHHTLAPASL